MATKSSNRPICISCQSEINDKESPFYNLNGEPSCKSCYTEIWKCNSVLCKITPVEFEMNVFTAGSLSADTPLPYPVTKVFWMGHDDSKGYTSWEVEDEFSDLVKGWMTDFADRGKPQKKKAQQPVSKD